MTPPQVMVVAIAFVDRVCAKELAALAGAHLACTMRADKDSSMQPATMQLPCVAHTSWRHCTWRPA